MDIVTANMTADRFWELLSKKISSEASEAELKELEEIVLNRPDLKATADVLSIFQNQVIPFTPDIDAELAFEKHAARIAETDTEFPALYSNISELESRSKARPVIRRWAVPAVLTLIALVSFLIFKNNIGAGDEARKAQTTQSQVSTKPGSKTQIQLPDGSTVWLNASSNLTYGDNFGKKFREVNLTGEAFFDVVKDASHPFIIHTKVVDVKVLGTAFNIKSYPNDANTETSVLRGKVEVTVKNRENTKYYLEPNEKVIVANKLEQNVVTAKLPEAKPILAIQPLTYYRADSSIIETSWVENKLVFQENETFREVALKMERWYGIHIRFLDNSVADYRMYGSFTTETIKQALDALKMGFNFNYKLNKDEVVISK